MDTTNVNSGEKNGLKRHLEHKVPLLKWIGCNNHKLALTFKHLIPPLQCVAEIDIVLNLWKYFKYRRPLAMNILGNTSGMYGDSLKGYLHYKTIFSHKVALHVQLMNFFI